MESVKRRSQRDYTLTFKLSVGDQVEKGEPRKKGTDLFSFEKKRKKGDRFIL